MIKPVEISKHFDGLKTSVLPPAECPSQPCFKHFASFSDISASVETGLCDVSAPVLALLGYLLYNDGNLAALALAGLVKAQRTAFLKFLLKSRHPFTSG